MDKKDTDIKLEAVRAEMHYIQHDKERNGSFLTMKFLHGSGGVNDKTNKGKFSLYSIFAHVFIELLAYMITGGLLGYLIDFSAGLAPLWTIIMSLIAFAGFMMKIYRDFFMNHS